MGSFVEEHKAVNVKANQKIDTVIRATIGFRINNTVVELLQNSGSRIEHWDGFSSYK